VFSVFHDRGLAHCDDALRRSAARDEIDEKVKRDF